MIVKLMILISNQYIFIFSKYLIGTIQMNNLLKYNIFYFGVFNYYKPTIFHLVELFKILHACLPRSNTN